MWRRKRLAWAVTGLVSVASVSQIWVGGVASATDGTTTAGVGLASTPPMGWNSWYPFAKNINEDLIKAQADALVASGMRDAGYTYLVVDGGWRATTRDAQGNMQVDPAKFPHGMKAVADYVHSKGLKFGLHQPVGMTDCGGQTPGTQSAPGGEQQDANLFASWGIDFLKYDLCKYKYPDGATYDEQKEITKQAFERMGQALKATGRPIVYSISEYGRYQPWTWAQGIANMWRTTKDITNCFECGDNRPGFASVIDLNADLYPYSGPGGWNDPDMLQIGLAQHLVNQQPVPAEPLSPVEERSQFSMWAMLAAPLISSLDLTTMSDTDREILTNKEVIAVDQDAASAQGRRIRDDGDHEVWVRPLADGSRAVVLFNRGQGGATLSVGAADLGLADAPGYTVRDLWKHETTVAADTVSAFVPGHGVAMFRVRPGVPQQAPPSTVVSIAGGQDLVMGTPRQVSTTFTNRGRVAVQDVTLDLSVPAGWQVSAVSDNTPVDVDPGQSTTVTWQVVPPSGLDPGERYDLRGEANYRQGATPYSTASVDQVPVDPFGSYVPRSELTATASSQLDARHAPANVVDGDPQTFWQSAPASSKPLPATVTLDLHGTREVPGLTYLPRQDRTVAGFITGYTVAVSVDGTTFSTVATGTWSPDAKLKAASWPAVSARYVRLEVTAGVNGVASAAEINIASSGTG